MTFKTAEEAFQYLVRRYLEFAPLHQAAVIFYSKISNSYEVREMYSNSIIEFGIFKIFENWAKTYNDLGFEFAMYQDTDYI